MTDASSCWSMFSASIDEDRKGARDSWKTSTPFDRCLRSLSRVTNRGAERAIEEYVATLHDDARGAALDEMMQRQTGLRFVGSGLSGHKLH